MISTPTPPPQIQGTQVIKKKFQLYLHYWTTGKRARHSSARSSGPTSRMSPHDQNPESAVHLQQSHYLVY